MAQEMIGYLLDMSMDENMVWRFGVFMGGLSFDVILIKWKFFHPPPVCVDIIVTIF